MLNVEMPSGLYFFETRQNIEQHKAKKSSLTLCTFCTDLAPEINPTMPCLLWSGTNKAKNCSFKGLGWFHIIFRHNTKHCKMLEERKRAGAFYHEGLSSILKEIEDVWEKKYERTTSTGAETK